LESLFAAAVGWAKACDLAPLRSPRDTSEMRRLVRLGALAAAAALAFGCSGKESKSGKEASAAGTTGSGNAGRGNSSGSSGQLGSDVAGGGSDGGGRGGVGGDSGGAAAGDSCLTYCDVKQDQGCATIPLADCQNYCRQSFGIECPAATEVLFRCLLDNDSVCVDKQACDGEYASFVAFGCQGMAQ
jgi:hypothetical protein